MGHWQWPSHMQDSRVPRQAKLGVPSHTAPRAGKVLEIVEMM